jgi:hypothetical protein
MIHGKWMVLKGRMEIGNGGVPGIARLGKEAEIGKREGCLGVNPALPGMQQENRKQQDADRYE